MRPPGNLPAQQATAASSANELEARKRALAAHLDTLQFDALDAQSMTEELHKEYSAARAIEIIRALEIEPADFANQESRGFLLYDAAGAVQLRYHRDAYGTIALYEDLYQRQVEAQQALGQRVHKGHPLVIIGESMWMLQALWHAKRWLMLTLVEDSVQVGPDMVGQSNQMYRRLVTGLGLPHTEYRACVEAILRLRPDYDAHGWFPERTLLQLGSSWMSELPTYRDAGMYRANGAYIRRLMASLGTDRGMSLEALAEYLLSSMPGCRTARRKRSFSTDYDVVCTVDGPETDFRSEFGRCFVCECKDWKRTADFSTLAKFCRVLDSVKARFGIVFSPKGISREADRERIKMFHDRGVVIVVVDRADLERLAEGDNMVAVLRGKYDDIRLDLRPSSGRSD